MYDDYTDLFSDKAVICHF